MAEVLLHPHCVFGLRAAVRNNLVFLDDQTVIFPCGNICARYNIQQRCYRFITGTEKIWDMQALAISPDWCYLAVSERGERGTITIYDLQHEQSRKRKMLAGGDVSVQEFVCMAFSPDSKYLLGQAGGPEWTIFFWLWEKNKLLALVKSTHAGPIYQVSFNPQDSTRICVSGNGTFKLFRYVDGALKQTNSAKVETQNILSHAWMSAERIIAGTETGQLLVFESGDLRWEMSVANKLSKSERDTEDETPSAPALMPRVTVIKAYSKGFVCSAGPGTVCLFENTEEKDSYRQIREIKIPPDPFSNDPSRAGQQEITAMCISPSEENLATSTDQGQIYLITLASAEMSKQEVEVHFEFLSHSFHSGMITGLSVSIRKPLIATCSMDHSIRIWNYETGALELYKEFQEEVYSVALHPSGLFILAGFSDKLRLMNLLIDDIRTFKEFMVRSCRECVFSHGGHVFAAVSSNVIHLYSSTTFDNVLNLKGHSGKVQSVVWSADDSRLVSCGTDGAVYEWNTLSGQRESESVLKSCSYTSVALSPDTRSILVVGTNCSLKEIQDGQVLREVASEDVVFTAIVMTHSGRALFIGTMAGTIRAFNYPLLIQVDWTEYQAHSGPITKMVFTSDDQYLLTVSEDGCLFIWKVTEQDGLGPKMDKDMVYAEEVLITKTDLEEKNQLMLELRTRVEELKMENEYQLRLKDMNYNEKINEFTEKFIQQIESLTTQNQALTSEKEKQEVTHQGALKDIIEKHTKEQHDLESSNNLKLMLEYEKQEELRVKLQKMQESYEEKLRQMEDDHRFVLEGRMQFYDTKMQEKVLELGQCQDTSQQQLREFEEIKKQIEEDADLELHDIRVRYERKLWEEKETNLKLNAEARVMKKKFVSMQKEIDNCKLDLEKMKMEQQKLHGVIRALEKDIMELKREIWDRDESIQDKENCIYNLQKKKEELEKFKFLLDYRVNELKKQIEPRENEVKEMKDQVHEMEGELDQFREKTTHLELTISELKLKLKATDKERQRETQRVRDASAVLHRMKRDLHGCVAFIQEPKKLKESIRGIYQHYVQQSYVEIRGEDGDVEQEYSRQREAMERNMETLKKKLDKEIKLHQVKNTKLMKENVSLIKEINKLRMMRAPIQEYETPSMSRSTGCKTQASLSEASQLRTEGEAECIIQQQRLEIQRLKQEILVQREGHGQSFLPSLPSNTKLVTLT